jgi:hypothetical protein
MSITHTITEVQGKINLSLEALDLAAHFGGTWGEHPHHEVGDWAYAIASEDTRLGYWEWVANRIDSGDFDLGDNESDDDADEGGGTDDQAGSVAARLAAMVPRPVESIAEALEFEMSGFAGDNELEDDQVGSVVAVLKAGFDEMFE